MEIGQFKKSMQEIARTVGAIVEEKLGERSHLEEQVRNYAKQVERTVGEALSGLRTTEKVTVKFKRLEHFKGDLPSYATSGSSGMDVRACLDSDVTLKPGERSLIPTGLSVEFPCGYEMQVRPRSGLAVMKGLSIVNAPGTVDSDYRGEIKVIVINLGKDPVVIADQERIAQLVICPVVRANIELAEDLSATERAHGGFGSTGV